MSKAGRCWKRICVRRAPRKSRCSRPSRGSSAKPARSLWSWTPRRPATPCCCSMPPAPITAKCRQMASGSGLHFTTPMMQLQDPKQTKVLIVTLAETTPVLEAAHLQDDLRRAGIEPWAWIDQQQPDHRDRDLSAPATARRARVAADRGGARPARETGGAGAVASRGAGRRRAVAGFGRGSFPGLIPILKRRTCHHGWATVYMIM